MQRQITDFTKVLAAIAVIGIHATSTAEYNFFQQHDVLSLDFLGVLMNQIARFSVPLFLYLSAYGLAKSEKKSDHGFAAAYVDFLWKRLPTILVPYFFFSGISLVLEFHSYRGTTSDLASLIVNKLRIGAADYHLYFLVILAQCYLLFPLLTRISRLYAGIYRILTGLTFVLVAGLLYKGSSEFLLPKFGLSHPGWHASFVIYWLPYFLLGILHAHRPPAAAISAVPESTAPAPEKNLQLWKSSPGGQARTVSAAVFALMALVLVVTEYIYYSRQGSPVDYYNHFSRPSVMLYALAVVYLLHSLIPGPSPEGRRENELIPPSPSGRAVGLPKAGGWGVRPFLGSLSQRVAALAPLTFSVYLIHPQVLRLLTNYAAGLPSVFTWMITVAVTFTLVYGLTLLTNKATQKSPVYLAGPVQFLQRCLGLR